MLFLEEEAPFLLVLHTISAAALVAASTHWVIWMRGYADGRFARHRAVRRFSFITAGLFTSTFLLGNLMYPVYKVRVRMEYLDRAAAVVADRAERRAVRERVEREYRDRTENDPSEARDRPWKHAGAPADSASELPRTTARRAIWFDVKEHWTALGWGLSLGCALLFSLWDPRRGGGWIAPYALALAALTAATAWMAAIIGIVVASYRSVGGVG